ncbi:acriflavine resistance B, putative [Babesia ovata]|uniref:Acriflavine resistance B, putative n=1 Tax=Babesia ovata TaxID=189622 RepID=A0A2H6KE36_9APIC|nr:acriflavine resistance B, putative [Babesia ovata]GBE61247.1 acriflavine resistance B, putative [Babesia ovata]
MRWVFLLRILAVQFHSTGLEIFVTLDVSPPGVKVRQTALGYVNEGTGVLARDGVVAEGNVLDETAVRRYSRYLELPEKESRKLALAFIECILIRHLKELRHCAPQAAALQLREHGGTLYELSSE